MFNNAKRLADENVYLNQDRYNNPKECFRQTVNYIKKDIKPKHSTLLDVGCATGEFIFYLKKQFKELKFTGIDISDDMIRHAKKNVPNVNFKVKSIFDKKFFKENNYDIVICSGTLSIFDDITTPLNNLINATNPGGLLYIITITNVNDVDLLIRYRLPRSETKEWQTGWNVFSKYSHEEAIKANNRVQSIAWCDSNLTIKLKKQKDPMRSYHNEHGMLVNGAGLILDQKLIKIKIK